MEIKQNSFYERKISPKVILNKIISMRYESRKFSSFECDNLRHTGKEGGSFHVIEVFFASDLLSLDFLNDDFGV